MLGRMLSVAMMAGLLAGCGTPMVAPAASGPVARMQAVEDGLILTSGNQHWVTPDDVLPAHGIVTVSGTKDGQPFNLVIAMMRDGHHFVALGEKATLNGQDVPVANWKDLANQLRRAKKANNNVSYFVDLACQGLRFATPPTSR